MGADRIDQLLAAADFGQTYYLVDHDFRTAAQGWSKADGTGPLDLYDARNPGYVFRTGDPANLTDAQALQAAIDEMVDFRGDTLYFTPGTYTPATALVINVPNARWTGQRRERSHTASLVAGVAAAFTCTAAADNMDVSFLRMVPLTAEIMWSLPAAVDNFDIHDFTYDARGIGASTATIFLKHTGACLATSVRRFTARTNTALGPLVQTAGASIQGEINGFQWFHTANTLVTLLYETITGATGATGWMVGNGHVQIGGGGVVTNLGAQIDMTAAGTNATLVNITTSVAGATAALGWEATTGVAGEGDIVRCTVALIAGGTATVGSGGGSAIFGTT
jgi:hypothetical protein